MSIPTSTDGALVSCGTTVVIPSLPGSAAKGPAITFRGNCRAMSWRAIWVARSGAWRILAGLPAGVLGLPGWSPAVPARPHEPGLVGDDHQLRPVPRSQLQHGAADVGLGGGRADIEPSGDLGVGQSFPD